jgi:16S rRNA (cytidine1402-2'-O)-methyltransferase
MAPRTTPNPDAGGRLVLVATPIGNLGDLSPRAVETLRRAALICCEDTRRTGRLLQHAGVPAPDLAVCNEHTEAARISDVLATLGDGGDVAVVTDAGTPGVSDPGERLVRAVLDAGFEVTSVPGPTALVTALVTSGLATGRFVFEGFLPRSGRARQDRLAELEDERRTIVVYEAPHRVLRTLADLAASLGDDRPVAVARELTKLWETVVRGTLGSVELGQPRGEYVLVIAGATAPGTPPDDDAIREALRVELAGGASTRDAAGAVARRLGVAKRLAYNLAVTESRRSGTIEAQE